MLRNPGLLKGLLPVTRLAAVRDGMAGVVLASMDIPQLLGYARIAGMPTITGLYAGVLPIIAFAIFGASRNLVVAADSATATILASRLSTLAEPLSVQYIALAGMTALLTAMMLLVARVFRLGFLADFLSRTVLVGFLGGVGVQVGVAVLGDMLGITVSSRGTPEQIRLLFTHLPALHGPELAISTLVVAAVLLLRHHRPRWPMALAAVVMGTAASIAWHFPDRGISVIGPLSIEKPRLYLLELDWRQTVDLFQVALPCFVVVLAQSAATSRAFAELHNQRADENADLLGLAAANVAAALSGTFVVNGSPTQTAMAERAGARSQMAQLTLAAVVIMVLLFLGQWLQYLPQCVLASIVFTIAVELVAVRRMNDIRRESPGEFLLALVTALTVIVAGVGVGISLAILLSLLRHVRHSYRPHTMVLAPNRESRWEFSPSHPGLETAPGLIVYRFGSDLFYANEHLFVDEARRLIDTAPSPVHWFIVDASAITDLDYSAGRSINELCKELAGRGIEVIFARVIRYLRADMDRHGVTSVIGADHIFETLHEALAGVQGKDGFLYEPMARQSSSLSSSD